MKNRILFYGVLLLSTLMYAQPADPPADDDPPASNINMYVVGTFLTAIVLAYFIILKKQKKYDF